jgi:hypothetical protein
MLSFGSARLCFQNIDNLCNPVVLLRLHRYSTRRSNNEATMSSAPAKNPTAPKPAAKSASAKVTPIKSAPAVKPDADAAASADKNMLRTKDLVARVAEATGGKVKDVRDTVGAVLAELGKALDAGAFLNLPPLGKVKIVGTKGEPAGQPLKLKLHRPGAAAGGEKPGKQALADDGEDS